MEPGLGSGGEHAGVLLGCQRKDLGHRVIPDDPPPRFDPPRVGHPDIDEGNVGTAGGRNARLLSSSNVEFVNAEIEKLAH